MMIVLTTQLVLLPTQEMVFLLPLPSFPVSGWSIGSYRRRRGIRHAIHARCATHAICQTVGTHIVSLQRKGHLTGTWKGTARASFSLSFDTPILPGREKSLTLDFSFSFKMVLPGWVCCSFSVGDNPGDEAGDLGNTTLAAV